MGLILLYLPPDVNVYDMSNQKIISSCSVTSSSAPHPNHAPCNSIPIRGFISHGDNNSLSLLVLVLVLLLLDTAIPLEQKHMFCIRLSLSFC